MPDQTRFDAAYASYARTVYRTAYQYTMNPHTAEDIMQEVFIKYMTKSPLFLQKEHEKAWLIRVTINLCKDLSKSKAYHTAALPDVLPAPDTIEQWELAADLEAALKQLREEERTALYLFYYEQYTTAEIARMLKQKESTVRSRLARARKKLSEWEGVEL